MNESTTNLSFGGLSLCCLANEGDMNLSFGRDGASVFGPTSDEVATLSADAARVARSSDVGPVVGGLALCCLANEGDTNLSFDRDGASVFGSTFGDFATLSAGATRVACSSDAGRIMGALALCCLANEGDMNLSFGRDGASVFGPTSDDTAALSVDATRVACSSVTDLVVGALSWRCLANEDDTNLGIGRDGASVFGPTSDDNASLYADATRVGGGSDAGRGLGVWRCVAS